jgi:1-acyl-sn-glycerol-3-phosphate acyltransferase
MTSIKQNLIGIISFLVLFFNTFLLAFLMIPLGIIKFFIPLKKFRASLTKFIIRIGEIWISINSIWVIGFHRPNIEIIGLEEFDKDSWYLATSNHQSAADIFLVQRLTNKKIPMLKFFIKYILAYVPIIGLCWWALDMPFLRRYTKEDLKKNPSFKGKDYEKMKKSLEHYSLHPVSIFSYAEGTRFTEKKHSEQNSPYKNLLRPKEGGLAIALSNVPNIKYLIDMTFIYESDRKDFWYYLCGRMKNIKIYINKIEIPTSFINEDLVINDSLRSDFKIWLNTIWSKKDQLITENKFSKL